MWVPLCSLVEQRLDGVRSVVNDAVHNSCREPGDSGDGPERCAKHLLGGLGGLSASCSLHFLAVV